MNVAGRYVGGKELRRWSEIVCPSIRAGVPKQVNRSGHGVSVVLHPAVDRAGKEAAKHRPDPEPEHPGGNGRAVWRFCQWCDAQRVRLQDVSSPTVATYRSAWRARTAWPGSGAARLADPAGCAGVQPGGGPRALVVRERKTPVLGHAGPIGRERLFVRGSSSNCRGCAVRMSACPASC